MRTAPHLPLPTIFVDMHSNTHHALSSARCCWLQVFLNGMWVGIHRNPIELVRTLRSLRRAVSCQGYRSA
jgi:hypothetical protein